MKKNYMLQRESLNGTISLALSMPLRGNDMVAGESPCYEIIAKKTATQRAITRIGILKSRLGYLIDRYDYGAMARPKVLGFAFTAKGADKFAHQRALSALRSLSVSLGNMPFEDVSLKDIGNLFNTYQEFNIDSSVLRKIFYR